MTKPADDEAIDGTDDGNGERHSWPARKKTLQMTMKAAGVVVDAAVAVT